MPSSTELNSSPYDRVHIIRVDFAYSKRTIVCDFCGHRLSRSFHYIIRFDNGDLANTYPFHTLRCAVEYVKNAFSGGVRVDIYPQEDLDENTED